MRLEEPGYSDECWFTTKACAYEDATILIGAHSSLPDRAPDVVDFLRNWDFNADTHLRSVARWQADNPDASTEDAGLHWLSNNISAWRDWVTEEAYASILAVLPSVSTDPCVTSLGTLSGAVTQTGSWRGGCDSANRSGSQARFYSFTLEQRTEVTFDLTSEQDTYLYLLQGAGKDGTAVHDNDDAEAGNPNSGSRITATLEAGEYTVEATTYSAGATGDFTLAITPTIATTEPPGPEPSDPCGQTLTGDGTVTGEWAAGCNSEAAERGYARYYTLALAQESAVAITLESQDADTYLYLREGEARSGDYLYRNDDDGATSRSSIQETLAAGTYTIEATTYGEGETGSFTLTVAGLGATTPPGPEPTDDCGQALTGDGTVSGEWASGCESEVSERGYARYYSFTAASESEVTITLESADADTYLYLRAGEARSGDYLHQNDDDGGTTRSQIRETLAAGTYTIEATTYGEGETGSFTLTVTGLSGTGASGPGTDCYRGPLPSDGIYIDQWEVGCESETPAPGSGSGARLAHYYTFTLAQESAVTIALESQDADTYLYLRAGESRSGAFLYENDDYPDPGDTDKSQIQETLGAGTYTIEATTYGVGETGSFTLTISGLGATSAFPPGSPATDRDALVALYNATDGPNWADNTNWLSDAPLDEWRHVSTDSTGRVNVLDLNYNQLSGEIPAELGNLPNLEFLNLSVNQLTGEIPAELGNLPNLKWLDFQNNELSGKIPAELGNLSNLEGLDLYGNQLSGEIPAELGKLSNLEYLYLGGNQLNGEMPAELGSLSNLLHLSLGGNQLNGEMPAELGDLASLTSLQLSANRLSGEIPPWLGDLANLEGLHLADNQLNGEIPTWLGDLANLEWLSLRDNQLSGEIPAELGSLSNLEYLYLGGNQLNGEIPAELGSLSNLLRLYLGGNQLNGEMPAELGSLSNLVHLYLDGNQLSGEMPAELGDLAFLEGLRLGDNQLNGEIPTWLGDLASLTSLDLSGNQLSGEIPPQLGNLANLEWLDLSGNQLSGEIPPQLGNLANLYWRLDLSGNQLSGEIPAELGNLASLEALYLFSNQLTGEIPAELGSLANLRQLYLSGNQLTGCVPAGLRDVPNNDFAVLGLPFCVS